MTLKIPVVLNQCEHECTWETQKAGVSTQGELVTVYRSYSCNLFYCKYPEKNCRVKHP